MFDTYVYHKDPAIHLALKQLENRIMANFDAVNAANAALKSEVDRAIVLLNSIPQKIADAVAGASADQGALDAMALEAVNTATALKTANDGVA